MALKDRGLDPFQALQLYEVSSIYNVKVIN
jgi:hypothetical protein